MPYWLLFHNDLLARVKGTAPHHAKPEIQAQSPNCQKLLALKVATERHYCLIGGSFHIAPMARLQVSAPHHAKPEEPEKTEAQATAPATTNYCSNGALASKVVMEWHCRPIGGPFHIAPLARLQVSAPRKAKPQA